MGLDQSAFWLDKEDHDEITKNWPDIDDIPDENVREDLYNAMNEIQYWRKHNRLQGYMQNLWMSRNSGSTAGEFNGVHLELTKEDILLLQECINNKALPKTEGFFFGVDSYSNYEEYYKDGEDYKKCDKDGDYYEKYYKDSDENFIDVALTKLDQGHKVFYTCCW